MVECQYERCDDTVFKDGCCILHFKLPDENDPTFNEAIEEKERAIEVKLDEGIYNFEGVHLLNIDFKNKIIGNQGDDLELNFSKSKIYKNINFDRATIHGSILCEESEVDGNVSFNLADVYGAISFNKCPNINRIDFDRVKVSSSVSFEGVCLLGDVNFDGSSIGGNLSFLNVNPIEWNEIRNIRMKFKRCWVGRTLIFTGAKLKSNINFEGSEIDGHASFEIMNFDGSISFERIKIKESIELSSYRDINGNISFIRSLASKVDFMGLNKVKNLYFQQSHIMGDINLNRSEIVKDALFDGTKIDGIADFEGINVGQKAVFNGADINGNLNFSGAIIAQDLDFNYARIGANANFHTAQINGKLNFENTEFNNNDAQEEACRKAKIIWEGLGNRNKADHYFYREMRANRLQKNRFIQILEKIGIELPFKYGIAPFRVIGLWLMVILFFGVIYWFLNAVDNATTLIHNIYFSVFAATGFDYNGFQLKHGYQFLASLEVVFGIFIWAAFLVIFARKYMR